MKSENKPDKQNIGNAGEYFVASVLSANGFTTTITLGRAEAYDIIAICSKTKKAIKIQVKTSWSNTTNWKLGEKSENNFDNDFFYFFVNLNELKGVPDYWVVSSKIVAKYIKERHQIWLNTKGKKVEKHTDTSMREFSITVDKYTPSQFKVSDLTKGHNNINEILEFDKN